MSNRYEDCFSKLNCWEYKKCGRELGGANTLQHGICPVSIDIKYEGVHDGICAGRACWTVAGTLCDGLVMGSFARKYNDCTKCDFYKMVEQEEGSNFLMIAELLAIASNHKLRNRVPNRGYDLTFLSSTLKKLIIFR